MSANAFLRPLWRALGGVVGVSVLLGLAWAIGWTHQGLLLVLPPA